MKTKILLVISALLASAHAEVQNVDGIVRQADAAIELGYLRASTTLIAAAAQPLDAALAREPKNPALLYERAFAHYASTAPLRATNNKPAMLDEWEKAVVLLEDVKGQPWEAEAAALHGSILGSMIGLKGGLSGMTLGPKSSQLIARAAKVLPGNPRVLLFQALALFNTPAAFGGDPVKAEKLFQQAADVFAKADATTPGPHWGHADALTWLGIAKKKSGDLVGARAAWEQALALEPDFGWVKFALLPSLAQKTEK